MIRRSLAALGLTIFAFVIGASAVLPARAADQIDPSLREEIHSVAVPAASASFLRKPFRR